MLFRSKPIPPEFKALRSDVFEMRYEELSEMLASGKTDPALVRTHVWKLQAEIEKAILEDKDSSVKLFSLYLVRKNARWLDQQALYASL